MCYAHQSSNIGQPGSMAPVIIHYQARIPEWHGLRKEHIKFVPSRDIYYALNGDDKSSVGMCMSIPWLLGYLYKRGRRC